VHIVKVYTESGGVVELIINVSIDKGEWSASCLGHLTIREIAPVAIVLEAGGLQSQSR
jgi:hypothetical protein